MIRGKFGAVLFLDGGNVWADSWDIDLRDLRYAVGPGCATRRRLARSASTSATSSIPIPGLLVNGEPQQRRWRIHFSIGQAFLRGSGAECRIADRLASRAGSRADAASSARPRPASSCRRRRGSRTGCAATSCARRNQYLNGTLSIERLGGNLFFGLEMENIGVSMDGSQVVAVKDLGLDYNVFQLISKGLSVDNIRLNKPVDLPPARRRHVVDQPADQEAGAGGGSRGSARPISIDAIGITDGSVVIDGPVGTSGVEVPKRFEHLDAKLAFKYEPVRYSIEITQVSFRGSEPALARQRAVGRRRRFRTTRSSSRSSRCGRRRRRCRSTARCSTI